MSFSVSAIQVYSDVPVEWPEICQESRRIARDCPPLSDPGEIVARVPALLQQNVFETFPSNVNKGIFFAQLCLRRDNVDALYRVAMAGLYLHGLALLCPERQELPTYGIPTDDWLTYSMNQGPQAKEGDFVVPVSVDTVRLGWRRPGKQSQQFAVVALDRDLYAIEQTGRGQRSFALPKLGGGAA